MLINTTSEVRCYNYTDLFLVMLFQLYSCGHFIHKTERITSVKVKCWTTTEIKANWQTVTVNSRNRMYKLMSNWQHSISQTSTRGDYRLQTDAAWLWPETISHSQREAHYPN